MNIFNAVPQENVDMAATIVLFAVIAGSLVLLLVVGFLSMSSETKTKDAWMKSLVATNSRYGVELSQNDVIILKQIPQLRPGMNFIWTKPMTYKGPTGDNTINLTHSNGSLISNVSLEDNEGDWVLKSNGIELPRVQA